MASVNIYEKHLRAVDGELIKVSKGLRLSIGELFFVTSFIVNFILGKLVHLLSPEEEVYNYYNDKKNILNQLFVKKGWGWTTFCVVLFYVLVIMRNRSKQDSLKSESATTKSATTKTSTTKSSTVSLLTGVVVRYIIATIWWIFFTQWFFGFPIMDRVFVFTGGQCVIDKNVGHPFLHLFQANGRGKFGSMLVSSYHCRRIRGSWEGGHDPSGHVFLMVHSSLYMFMEGLSQWTSWNQLGSNIRKFLAGLSLSRSKVQVITHFLVENPHIVLIQLITLWWFMLLMTNIYFHSIYEKLVGLAFGYFGVFVVYLVPRYLK